MSYAVGTTHYNLPQTQGSDKRDWSDTNQAFADLDAAVYDATTDSATAISTANSASSTATSAATDAASAVTTANAASAAAQTAGETAALARTEAQGASTVAGQANTTAQAAQTTASNADTVALAAQSAVGDLTQLQTANKSSAVAAINEVNAGISSQLGMPDYDNPVTITGIVTNQAKEYTPNANGFLKVHASSTTSILTLAEIFYGTGFNTPLAGAGIIGSGVDMCVMVPVLANKTYTIFATGNNVLGAEFIPTI